MAGSADARSEHSEALLALARRLGERLAGIPGIVAVVAGGSTAAGTADELSDLDLGLLYRVADRFDLGALRRLASEVDDRGAVELTEPGGWGPRIDGGGWLVVEGRRVDWLYRDVGALTRAVADVRAGRSPLAYQPGHPFGWQPQMYAAEVAYGIAVHDPVDVLGMLRAGALPYPEALRAAKIAELWEGRFTLDVARSAASRGDFAYVAGCLWRAAMLVVQALFALNGRYLLNEKRAVHALSRLDVGPRDGRERIQRAFSALAADRDGPRTAIVMLGELLTEVEQLTAGADEPAVSDR